MKDLERFVEAQASMYAVALKEIEQGCKQSHWIWFIFPQHEALGYSNMAKFYGIRDLEEARAYLAHPLLGARLEEISRVLLAHRGKAATAILGEVDALKVRSSMTLFELVRGESVFTQVLGAFYNGERDAKTLTLVNPPTRRGLGGFLKGAF